MSVIDIHVEQTEAFIEANPVDLPITRAIRESDDMGGQLITSTEILSDQTVRVIELNPPQVRLTPDGREIAINAAVVGLPDLDISADDVFEYNSRMYEVASVSKSPFWHTMAGAVSRG